MAKSTMRSGISKGPREAIASTLLPRPKTEYLALLVPRTHQAFPPSQLSHAVPPPQVSVPVKSHLSFMAWGKPCLPYKAFFPLWATCITFSESLQYF